MTNGIKHHLSIFEKVRWVSAGQEACHVKCAISVVPGIQLLELKAGLRQEIQRYFYEISQVVPYTLKDASQTTTMIWIGILSCACWKIPYFEVESGKVGQRRINTAV